MRSSRFFLAAGFLLAATVGATADPCIREQDVEKRIAACTSAINNARDDQDRALRYSMRADAYSERGTRTEPYDRSDLQRTLDDYASAIKLSPKDPSHYYGRATTFGLLGDEVHEKETIEAGLQQIPNTPLLLKLRGDIVENMDHDYDKAAADFTLLIEADPTNPEGYELRGRVWREKGNSEKAELDEKEAEAKRTKLMEAQQAVEIRADNFNIEPIMTDHSTHYAIKDHAKVHSAPSNDSPVELELSDGQKFGVIGRTRNSYHAAERWYQIDYADKKPRFISGADILDEKSFERRQNFVAGRREFPEIISKVKKSSGRFARYAGFYTNGDACKWSVPKLDAVNGFEEATASMNLVLLMNRGLTSYVLWFEGEKMFAMHPLSNLKHELISTSGGFDFKGKTTGTFKVVKFTQVLPSGNPNADLASIGFGDDGRILLRVVGDRSRINYLVFSKCDLDSIEPAVISQYDAALSLVRLH